MDDQVRASEECFFSPQNLKELSKKDGLISALLVCEQDPAGIKQPEGKGPGAKAPEEKGKDDPKSPFVGGQKPGKRHFRAVFISDTHLGTRAARADLLLDFLKGISCDYLYLVGDIVDGWRLKKSWYWDTIHNDVIRRILKMAKSGVKVVYIPGNHDEGLRGFVGHNLAGVSLKMDAIHTGATGKKYWVIHGDEFDGVVLNAKWLAHLGDWAYQLLIRINMAFNWFRRHLGYSYWSLSAYLKHKVKNAVEFIGRFEESVAQEAARRKVDGVICGHIHNAEQRMIGKIEYKNDGDWVESCTALVENDQGEWSIIRYAEEVAARQARKAMRKAAKKASGKKRYRPAAYRSITRTGAKTSILTQSSPNKTTENTETTEASTEKNRQSGQADTVRLKERVGAD